MLDLVLAELKRSWSTTRRYPMELASGLALMVIAFYALFLGARYIAGPAVQFGEELDALILGYCLWSVVLFTVNGIALGLQNEALTGTLEQIYLSPHGPLRVIFARMLASFGLELGSALVMLLVLLALTGRSLSFPPAVLLPFAAVLLAAYGIGLMMAALALLAKRVQQVLTLAQFAILFLVVAPIETLLEGGSWSWVLPIAPGAAMLRDLMVRHQAIEPVAFIRAILVAGVYLGLGVAVYRLAQRRARREGLLGQY